MADTTEEVDYSTLPLMEKLNHKVWKARLLGYEELAKQFRMLDPEKESDFKKYMDHLKKIATDSNIVAQEAGLVTLAAWAANAPQAPKTRAVLVPLVIEKSLAQMRAGTKAKALEVLLMFIEIDMADPVIEDMLPFLEHKTPKLVAGCIAALRDIVRIYGTKTVNVKPLLKRIPVLFAHTDKKVREEATQLVIEMYKWLGPAIETYLSDLKPVQKKDLTEAFQTLPPGKPTPERLLRSQQAVSQMADDALETDGAEEKQAEEVDAFDLAEPVDLLAQMPKNFYTDLASSKWKDRKEALENLLAIAKTPRLADGNYGEVIMALGKRVADANINVVTLALNLIECIANGLRSGFQKYKSMVISPILERCKEKKQTVVDALRSALDAVFLTLDSLSSCMDEVTAAMNHKNPSVKAETVRWLVRCLKITKSLPPKGEVKTLNEMLLKATDDSFVDVRESAFEGLGTLMKVVGERVMLPYLEKLDKIKEGRVREFYEKAEVKIGPAGRKPPPSSASASAAPKPVSAKPIKKPQEKCSDLKGAAANTVMPILESVKPATRTLSASVSGPTASPSVKSTTSEQKRVSASSTSLRPSASARSSLKRKSVSVPQMSSTAASKIEAIDSGEKKPPILTADPKGKDARAAHDKGMTKWAFEVPRKELVEDLSQQMEPHFSREVHMLLFSTDHYRDKDNLAGLTLLDDAISSPGDYGLASEEMRARCVANSDSILKYLTLRFFDTNTSMLIKCLDLLERLVGVLDEEGYHLSEYEASSFLPFFINKVGDNKESMRTRIRGIMKQLCRIYPASKMFGYIMDHGLKSKNGRTRTECLEELGALIQRNGLAVCNQPSKSLSTIAHHISDRDNSVRSAAINTLLQVYILVGDKVFGYVGKLTDKDKSLLEERFKRAKPAAGAITGTKSRNAGLSSTAGNEVDESVPPPPKFSFMKKASTGDVPSRESPVPNAAMEQEPAAKSSSASSASPPVKKEFSLDLEKLELPTLSNTAHSDIPSRSVAAPMHSAPTPQIPKQRSSIALENREYVMDYVVSQITSGDAYQSIDALKQLETQLGGPPEVVIPHIDHIVNAITLQVRLAFTAPDSTSPTVVRLCKHLVNALVQVFMNKQYSLEVSTDALHPLLQELLHRLLDQNLTTSESGQQLARALNILMVRILDNAHRNASFSVLLSILDKSSAGLRVPETVAGPNAKFTELVMKCLWKLTKTLGKSVKTESISPEQLLMDVNHFLVSTPPAEWKRRAAEKLPLGDLPLRTAKTILHELVQALGEDVFGHLGFIPEAEKSYVYSYLRHMMDGTKKQASSSQIGQGSTASSLKSSKSEDGMAEESVARSTPELKSASRSSSTDQLDKSGPFEEIPPLDVSDAKAVDQRLSEIFARIGSKEHSKQGIYELHEFQVRYPEAQSKVDEHLSKTGTYFQSYIRRTLANVASGEGAFPMDAVSTSLPSSPKQSTSPSAARGDGEKLEPGKENSAGIHYVQRYRKIQQMVEQSLNNDKSRSTPELNEASKADEDGTPTGGGRGGLVGSASSLSSIAPVTSSSQIPDVSVTLKPATSIRREADAGDKAQTVAGLKERLERMKNSMRGNV